MNWPHWLEDCKGEYVAVSHSYVSKYQGSEDLAKILGAHTRPIAKCDTCGRLFATETLPGKWTLKELREM